jgi:Tfp pilus assembly protein FimT
MTRNRINSILNSVPHICSPSLKGRGRGLGRIAPIINFSTSQSNRRRRGTPSPAVEDAHRLLPAASEKDRAVDGSKRRARFAGGFTLLELAVVLFLMGLMLLIAMPYVGGFSDAQLKSVSRRLAGRARYLYEEAAAHKLVVQLVFDLDKNAYFVMTADPYAAEPAFYPDTSTSGARVNLPDSIRIRDVTVEGVGTLSQGIIATQFYPEGYVDATIIHLVDAKERVMTLIIDPLTGQVTIALGDLRPGPRRYGQ